MFTCTLNSIQLYQDQVHHFQSLHLYSRFHPLSFVLLHQMTLHLLMPCQSIEVITFLLIILRQHFVFLSTWDGTNFLIDLWVIFIRDYSKYRAHQFHQLWDAQGSCKSHTLAILHNLPNKALTCSMGLIDSSCTHFNSVWTYMVQTTLDQLFITISLLTFEELCTTLKRILLINLVPYQGSFQSSTSYRLAWSFVI